MSVKLLTEHHLEFLGFTGGYTGLSETKHVRMPHCWKSHVAAQLCCTYFIFLILQDTFKEMIKTLSRMKINQVSICLFIPDANYSKTCLKRPLKARQNNGLKKQMVA